MNRCIIVCGDRTIDWAVDTSAQRRRVQAADRLGTKVSHKWHFGGAFLMRSLLRQIIDDINKRDSTKNDRIELCPESQPQNDQENLNAGNRTLNHSYNIIRTYNTKDQPSLRIENFVGFQESQEWPQPEGIDQEVAPALVVIDDAGLKFGANPNLWPKRAVYGKYDGDNPWIILKIHGDSIRRQDKHSLWTAIHEQLDSKENPSFDDRSMLDRLIVITEVDSLRKIGAEVSRGLSWERSVQDIVFELMPKGTLEALSHCQWLIVSFGPAGALLINQRAANLYTLFFDRTLTEGAWARVNDDGRMFGYNMTLTACIAKKLIELGTNPSNTKRGDLDLALKNGIKDGLTAMRIVFHYGFHSVDPQDATGELDFPIRCIKEVKEVGDPSMLSEDDRDLLKLRSKFADKFREAPVDPPLRRRKQAKWSIFDQQVSGYGSSGNPDTYALNIAMSIAREGPNSELTNVPFGNFRRLQTFDRTEIEGIRSVQNLVTEYWDNRAKTMPRSIAVFGAPGDGKSFAVKQVVRDLQEEKKEKWTTRNKPLEFNLSQFSSVEDLAEALHQVRDESLKSKIPPLVFWDEFDTPFNSHDLGWLRYFLGPMQDGLFRQGQITHPIGRAIFVFAGGVCQSFNEFVQMTRDRRLSNAKGVDFISRLRGHIDIIGPNPKKQRPIEKDYRRLVHRAILLYSCTRDEENEASAKVQDFDRGVLEAFLKIDKYRYGARSINAIVDMSRLSAGDFFQRSCLPPERQLDLHVDAKRFMRIVRSASPLPDGS